MVAWQNGKPGILLLIFKQPGANVIDAVERIKLLPHAAVGAAIDQGRQGGGPHHHHQGLGRTTSSSRCC
jgi:hypothetical protein